MLLIDLLFVCSFGSLLFLRSSKASDCTKANQEWMEIKYGYQIDPRPGMHPMYGDPSKTELCPVPGGTTSCCQRNTENEMTSVAQQLIENELLSNWLQVANQMLNDSIELESLFRSDLDSSKKSLHNFFSRIYGYNYKLHSSFFFRFFQTLDGYVNGSQGQLKTLIETFFADLRHTIIDLIERSKGNGGTNLGGSAVVGGSVVNRNSAGSLDGAANGGTASDEKAESERINCLSDRMSQYKPFDDADVHLRDEMLESYPPVRVLINILSVTSRLLTELINQLRGQPDCAMTLARSRFCVICASWSTEHVCPDSCPKQFNLHCLQAIGLPSFVANWSKLMESTVSTLSRLERSPFSTVNRRIQMGISDAITSLQSRYPQAKSKFEAECRSGFQNSPPSTIFRSSIDKSNDQSSYLQPSFPRGFGKLGGRVTGLENFLSRVKRTLKADERFGGPSQQQFYQSQVPQNFQNWQASSHRYPAQLSPHQMPTQMHSQIGYAPLPMPSPGQGNFGGGSMNWGNSDGLGTIEIAKILPQRIAAMKLTYSRLLSLFVNPSTTICSSPLLARIRSVNQNPNNCWSPPEFPKGTSSNNLLDKVSGQLTTTVKLLDAFLDNSVADPDILFPQLPRATPTSSQLIGGGTPYNAHSSMQYPQFNQYFDYPTQPNQNIYPGGNNMHIQPLGNPLDPGNQNNVQRPNFHGFKQPVNYPMQSSNVPDQGLAQPYNLPYGNPVDNADLYGSGQAAINYNPGSSNDQWPPQTYNSWDNWGDPNSLPSVTGGLNEPVGSGQPDFIQTDNPLLPVTIRPTTNQSIQSTTVVTNNVYSTPYFTTPTNVNSTHSPHSTLQPFDDYAEKVVFNGSTTSNGTDASTTTSVSPLKSDPGPTWLQPVTYTTHTTAGTTTTSAAPAVIVPPVTNWWQAPDSPPTATEPQYPFIESTDGLPWKSEHTQIPTPSPTFGWPGSNHLEPPNLTPETITTATVAVTAGQLPFLPAIPTSPPTFNNFPEPVPGLPETQSFNPWGSNTGPVQGPMNWQNPTPQDGGSGLYPHPGSYPEQGNQYPQTDDGYGWVDNQEQQYGSAIVNNNPYNYPYGPEPYPPAMGHDASKGTFDRTNNWPTGVDPFPPPQPDYGSHQNLPYLPDTQWQENAQGSGSFEHYSEPEVAIPTEQIIVDPPTTTVEPLSVLRHRPRLPQPPPPEVWIPARLTHGQHAPPVLMVREYNVPGEYYQHETINPYGSCLSLKVTIWLLQTTVCLHLLRIFI